jgi:murein DD-endopeptidase MepM/ murein hydrolase activator NlpD
VFDGSFYLTPGNILAVHQANTVYRYPYAQADYFPIVQGFEGGYSYCGASKYAVDFAMPIGRPIHAARAGGVIDLAEHHKLGGASRKYAEHANYAVVLHADDITGEYYHLEKMALPLLKVSVLKQVNK